MINKMKFLPILFALASASHAQETRPNVLLIVADDMGFSDIGPFGGEISTPALDALAKEGLRLTNFHALASCSPSRSVLLSGMDNHRAGLGTMSEMMSPETKRLPGYEGYLNHRVAALPEVLQANGYKTYMVGKWHLGEEEKELPDARGFDDTFVLIEGGGSHWADEKWVTPTVPMNYSRNGDEVESLPDDFYSTKNYTDELIAWLERDQENDQPFFAYLSYTAPHDPLHAPDDYIAKYNDVYDGGWDVLRETRLQKLKELGIVDENAEPFPRLSNVAAWTEMSAEDQALAARDMEVYAAMVDYMDEQIKRVFDELKESGKYENTIILFMSDNGANGSSLEDYPGQTLEYIETFDNSLENRGLQNSLIDMGPGWAQASMTPSRMFKGFTAEGGIRSPLLVKMPGKMPTADGINGSFLHIRDIMPTILEATGIEQPKDQFQGRSVQPIQGTSVLPLLMGQEPETSAKNSDVGYELFGMKAYFDGDWKALWMPAPFGTAEWELYNLQNDPAELNDLSKEHPQKLEELVARWEQYSIENGVVDLSSNNSE
ncbi:arylsulfatase [Sulfitobacter sp. SK012]|uniref:arylsulfatase n=1 Tax=Sulfitobacter sp. SK012 TaxID=1389005 RepID=UPI000E0A7DA0|nr:sulfatase-like hydrolase/transferase [Sulfitobacter sp. SK012]AXI45505.1 arylsulfatase [Sulfitobacter sp. SK012]